MTHGNLITYNKAALKNCFSLFLIRAWTVTVSADLLPVLLPSLYSTSAESAFLDFRFKVYFSFVTVVPCLMILSITKYVPGR